MVDDAGANYKMPNLAAEVPDEKGGIGNLTDNQNRRQCAEGDSRQYPTDHPK